jgi:MFS transporter, DHA2 family, multidrug resistance protein
LALKDKMNATDSQAIIIPPFPRWIGFVAMCIGMFMAILDIQVVVTSIQVIEESLHIGADRMSWVQTAYIIAEVIAIPLTGLLTRVFSMRWLFSGALIAFTLASLGCAASSGFHELLVWRSFQGFAGGVLIPLVFSGIFLLFPKGFQQTLATTIGGFLAVMAPTLGPITGGWLTEHFSWQYLFLINVPPGIVAALAGVLTLPVAKVNTSLLKSLDWLSLVAFGLSLALMVIGLKEAPRNGWLSPVVISCLLASAACLFYAVRRPNPAIMFRLLHDRALAYGCVLSFILGFVLFSTVYVLPVFLAFVRSHGPFEIGKITLVMGLTQIVCAPIIVQIDRFFDARWLAIIGFVLFGVGLALDATLTIDSDYNDVFWPQVIRGVAVALCILPPIRLALSLQPIVDVNEASGLFNLVRNVGGVLGIAVSDTIMFSRAPIHVDEISAAITDAPEKAAHMLGMAVTDLPAPNDPTSMMSILGDIQSAGLTMAINECWWMLAIAAFLAVPVIMLVGPVRSAWPVRKLG